MPSDKGPGAVRYFKSTAMKRNRQAQKKKRLAQPGADQEGDGEYRQAPPAAEVSLFINKKVVRFHQVAAF